MSKFDICPFCGATLDHGETCDCRCKSIKEETQKSVFAKMKKKQNKSNQSPLSNQQERGTVLDKKENHPVLL